MPPYYFDSEDTSPGHSETSQRQFVPTNTAGQAALGEIATSTRRTLSMLVCINEADASGADVGYISFPTPDLDNWNDDWEEWRAHTGLELKTTENATTPLDGVGRWQDDLNIIIGIVIKINHLPSSGAIIPPENINWITGSNGITWYQGPGAIEPTGSQVAGVFFNSGASAGIRYPDFIFADLDNSGSMRPDDAQPGVDQGMFRVVFRDFTFNTYGAFPVGEPTNERYIKWMSERVEEFKDEGPS